MRGRLFYRCSRNLRPMPQYRYAISNFYFIFAYNTVKRAAMKSLEELLYVECDYRPSKETMDRYVGLMTEARLRNHEPLIPYGKLDTNIYVLKSGIMRYLYFDGLTERTFAFAVPGTMLMSWSSLYMRQPSFMQLESCGDVVVMKVTKSDFDALTEQSHDFAKWMMRLFIGQHHALEQKLGEVNGTAKERFESFFRNRPEIVGNVESKAIASYIGVTPSYLCRLRSRFRKKTEE